MPQKPKVERGRQVSPAAKQMALKLRELNRSAGTFAERRAVSAQIMSEALSQAISEFAEEARAEHAEAATTGSGHNSSDKEGH